ncbi:MAG TPA: HAMP domain-containing protein, partial [Polyangiales bacterium]|nr:HAMP domain-containing protein [Polyangiales bacterium]
MKLRPRIALATALVTAPMLGLLVWLDVQAQQAAAEAELSEMVWARSELPGERERCEAAPSLWQHAPRSPRGAPPPTQFGAPPPPSAAVDPPPAWPADTRALRPPPSAAGDPGADRPPPMAAGERRAQARPNAAIHRAPAQFFVYDRRLRSRLPDAPKLVALSVSEHTASVSLSTHLHPDRAEVLVRTPWPDSTCAFVLARGTTEPWLGALLPPTRIWALPTLMVFAAVLLAIGPVVRRIRRLTEAVQRSAAFDYAAGVSIDGDDEIAELARAFGAAGREVRTQLDAKDQRERALRNFVADTTHDVAIPLTVLQGHLATLQE